MKNNYRVYLAGGITNLSINEHNSWRIDFQKFLDGANLYNISSFNPVDHMEEINPNKMNEKQAMDYDLSMLRESDIVIVNFNDPKSIGTACELALAYEKRIPILGFNEGKKEIHPWLEHFCSKIFNDWLSLLTYFVEHYANEWI